LINQDRRLVETFIKHENKLWYLKDYEELDERFIIQTLNLEISMEAIYKDVVFKIDDLV